MALRDIVLWIQAKLHPQSAQQVQAQLQQALQQGTNPQQAQQNIGAIGSALNGLGNIINRVGKLFLVYFGGRAIVRFFEDSIMMFARFDQKMQQSIAIMDKVDAAMREKMGNRARQVAKELNIDATTLAETYLFLAQAGLNAAQAFEAMPVVAVFMKAGMMDAGRAAELLAQSVAALGYQSKDPIRNLENMARVADVVALAAARSQASIQEFATAIANKAGNSLRLFSKDVEEGVAALAVMANQGIKGAVAGERLDMFLRQATQAAVKHREAFKQFGIQIFDAQGNMRNLADIAEDLTRALGNLSDEQQTIALQQLGFQVRTVHAVKGFIDQADAIREYETQLRSAAGFAKEVADKQLLTPIEQWGLFRKRVDDARMSIGEAFIPALISLGDRLGDENNPDSIVGQLKQFARYIQENPEGIEYLGDVINWLVTKPLTAFWKALDMIADALVFNVSGSLFVLAQAFNLIVIAAGLASKVVGGFLSLMTFGFVDHVDKFGDALLNLQKKIDEFALKRGEAAILAGKHLRRDLMSLLTDEEQTKGKSGPRVIDGLDNLGPGGRDKNRKGTGTIPGLVDPDTADKIEKLNKRLAEMLAQHTATAVDEQILKVRELEKAFIEVFGTNLPSYVKDGLAKLRSAIGQEDAAKALQQEFNDIFKEVSLDELDVAKLGAFIHKVKDLRDETEKDSDAWRAFNKLLEEALALLGKFNDEKEKQEAKEAREAEQEYERRMRKIRRIGEHTADALADAFGMFFDVLVEGSERGTDAFEALGRGILAALVGGIAEWAMLKARANFIMAAEAVAEGWKMLGDPFTAGFAAAKFASAAKLAAVGAMWAAFGGVAGAGAASLTSNAHGLNRNASAHEPGSERVDDSRRQGPDIHIHIDGVDPKNPRHQKLIGDTIEEWAELTGGTVIIH